MKRPTVNLLGLAAVLLCIGLDALAQPYRHPATDLVFPEQLAGLERGDVTDYETKSPGLGVSVGYNVPGITVTIYLYTMGMKAVPDDLTSQPLKRHFAGVVSDVFRAGESGAYANVKKTAEGSAALDGSEKGPRALHASFSYSQKGRDRLSHLYLMGFRNHFLKVRFTYDKDMQETAEAVRVKLLGALDEMTGKPSGEPRRGEAAVAHALPGQ
ncbi:MAG: hypothetical protein KJ579_09150 [Verrucomicrobia bacterium]|nr:hypothetical protein [Verrucomicrobiota bacterium]